MSANSARDACAVGYFIDDTTGSTETPILHWDGTSWSQVDSPNRSINTELDGVSADSAPDAWAAGHYAHYTQE